MQRRSDHPNRMVSLRLPARVQLWAALRAGGKGA